MGSSRRTDRGRPDETAETLRDAAVVHATAAQIEELARLLAQHPLDEATGRRIEQLLSDRTPAARAALRRLTEGQR